MNVRIVTAFGRTPDGPGESDLAWLTRGERTRLEALKVEKRRADWLLGRFTAKRLVRENAIELVGREVSFEEFEIAAEPHGAPIARRISGERLPLLITISHSHGAAFCAALPDREGKGVLGGDLEWNEPRSDAFVRDFLTPAESASLERVSPLDRALVANAIWSAKEAVLKAIGTGLRSDTRDVEITLSEVPSESPLRPREDGWHRFDVACAPRLGTGSRPFEGFWRHDGGFAATLAARL